jgi:hypothetical protein
MTGPSSLRAFVNGSGVNVPHGASVLDAVRAADPAAADAVQGGTRAIADSRGLAIDPATPLTGGAVLRLVSAKARRADGAPE